MAKHIGLFCLGLLFTQSLGRISPFYIGADVSWLPEKEAAGVVFSDSLGRRDLLQILKDHGFNAIRLRIFNNPAAPGGYSPQGFCDLSHTLAMARRVKALGLALYLDFHYSDTWADPSHQLPPLAWRTLSVPNLRDSVAAFTRLVLDALKNQNTLPDLVQIGNEIDPGFLLPMGSTANWDSLGGLFQAGADAVRLENPSTKIVLHLSMGNNNAGVQWFVRNLEKVNVAFDVIALSCYTQFQGQPAEWKQNFDSLVVQFPGYHFLIAEYSQAKDEANRIPFELPDEKGLGAFIWEPTDYQEKLFDNGKANALLDLYPALAKEFAATPVALSPRLNLKRTNKANEVLAHQTRGRREWETMPIWILGRKGSGLRPE